MAVSMIPKEMLENEEVQKMLEGLKKQFGDIFAIIDEKIIPTVDAVIPENLKEVVNPMVKIQYANFLHTAFMDVYKDYISKASMDCTENLMYGGIK